MLADNVFLKLLLKPTQFLLLALVLSHVVTSVHLLNVLTI